MSSGKALMGSSEVSVIDSSGAQAGLLQPMSLGPALAQPQQHDRSQRRETQQREEPYHGCVARRILRPGAGPISEPAGDPIGAPQADVLQQRDDAECGAEPPRLDGEGRGGPGDRWHQREADSPDSGGDAGA